MGPRWLPKCEYLTMAFNARLLTGTGMVRFVVVPSPNWP
jgi:hypothetical protein